MEQPQSEADRKSVEVWVQSDLGQPWVKVGSHLAYGRTPRLAVINHGENPTVALALGPDCHMLQNGEWRTYRLGSEGSPLTSIIGLSNMQIACAAFDQLHRFNGETWDSLSAPDNKPITAMATTAEQQLVVLTTDGVIYQLDQQE